RYLDGRAPNSLVWSQRQEKRFGSCSTDTGAIRISSRLREVPAWVLEAVLIHELAHLSHPNHSAEFSALANRYPRQDEARLWLEGFEAGYQRSQEDNRD
ncbi:MAG: M48 family metallopeptidase, partial [Actinomycetota bacterium]